MSIVPMDLETHNLAIQLAERHGWQIFDALMIASAPQTGCATLWFEDMQDGVMLEGALRIITPFRGA